MAIANIKHSSTPRQININLHTKDLVTLIPITPWNISRYQQKLQCMLKRKEKSLGDKEIIRLRLRYDTDVGIVRRNLKELMIKMLRPLMESRVKYLKGLREKKN